MKVQSKLGASHSHTEGVTIDFVNGVFTTEKSQEISILKKYDGIYWKIQKEPPKRMEIKSDSKDTTKTKEVVPTLADETVTTDKPETLSRTELESKKRNELYFRAREKGYQEKYAVSSKKKLIEFIKKQ